MQVLLIGELSAPAMQPVREWLARRIAPSGQRIAVDLRSVRRLRDAEGWLPDLVLVCQTWSDQFSGVDIHALLTWFPLSRLVCVYDVWCDADGRSRNDWPLVLRVPASRATARLERELSALERDEAPLPLTASRGEIFGAEFPAAPPRESSDSSVRVVIDTPDAALARLWTTVLAEQGYAVRHVCSPPWEDELGVINASGEVVARTWPADPEGAEVVLFDADPEIFRQPHVVREIWPVALIIAMVGFRRVDGDRFLVEHGCDEVLDKLAPLVELLTAVRRATVFAE